MEKRLFRSFNALFLAVVMLSLLPAYAIIVYTGITHSRSASEGAREAAMRQIETLAMTQQTITESVHQILATLAILPGFREGRWDEQGRIMGEVLRSNPDLVNITFTDLDGIVRASARLNSGSDLSDRRHILRALESGTFSAGEFIHARVNQEPAFPWSLPVFDPPGQLIGTINTVYKLSAYRTLFDRLALPPDSVLGFTDHRGIRIFFHPVLETNPLGSPIKGAVWNQMRSGVKEADAFIQTGSDGIRRYYAYRKLTLEGQTIPYLYMVLGIPERYTRQPAQDILRRNLLFLGAATLLALLVSAYLGYRLIGSPLGSLVGTVRSIQDGRLDSRTRISRGPEEILQVAEAVDRMARTLEQQASEKEEDLKRISRALQVKENLLREVHHRVKNNLQLILSIINLEQENEHFRYQTENRIRAMASVHELLYQSDEVEAIEVSDFLQRLASLSSGFTRKSLFRVDAPSCSIPLDKAIPFALIVNELLLNALKYGTTEEGLLEVQLSCSIRGDQMHLEVSDSGPGFPPDFDYRSSGTLGMKLVSILSDQLQGSFEIAGRERGSGGDGGCVSITFPLEG